MRVADPFEGAGHLQHAQVIEAGAGDLQADGEAGAEPDVASQVDGVGRGLPDIRVR